MFSRLWGLGLGGFLRLIVAVCVLFIEIVLHYTFKFTPEPVIRAFGKVIAKVSGRRRSGAPEHPTTNMDTPSLAEFHGFDCEEHVVTTEDGYILTLHRIRNLDICNDSPVLLQHGLMQNSEAFCATDDGLAFTLARAGFDVWLGNNRGNRYSRKHTQLTTVSNAFWDYSIDHLALYDFPANINYVVHTTGKQIAYIGFSQGCAQAFAGLSLNRPLCNKLRAFIALAPASQANGFHSKMMRTFVSLAPDSLFMLFGRQEAIASTLFWRSFLPKDMFAFFIDKACWHLFGWSMNNMTLKRKKLLYAHLYSSTSVKVIVHWMQIVATKRFQMFDDTYNGSGAYAGSLPPRFDPRGITTPVSVFYGGSDPLPDFDWLLAHLPANTFSQCTPEYEHLDLIWADTAKEKVFPKVIEILNATPDSDTSLD